MIVLGQADTDQNLVSDAISKSSEQMMNGIWQTEVDRNLASKASTGFGKELASIVSGQA